MPPSSWSEFGCASTKRLWMLYFHQMIILNYQEMKKKINWNIERYFAFLCALDLTIFFLMNRNDFMIILKKKNHDIIEGDWKWFALAKNLAINKKSTIVVQSLWNLVKIFTSWVLYVTRISAWLDQNCGFFINSQVFSQCKKFWITL